MIFLNLALALALMSSDLFVVSGKCTEWHYVVRLHSTPDGTNLDKYMCALEDSSLIRILQCGIATSSQPPGFHFIWTRFSKPVSSAK